MKHLADIMCGECGHLTRIALGMASAILCPGCKTEIVLGEAEPPQESRNGYRVKPCICGSSALPVALGYGCTYACPDCGSVAPIDGQIVVAWR